METMGRVQKNRQVPLKLQNIIWGHFHIPWPVPVLS